MIQSLIRAMEILEHLRETDRPTSLAELVQRSGLPPSTVHRILQTFCSKNYVLWDEKAHLYRLGPSLIPLGTTASRQLQLRDVARPVLTRLMQATGEDSFLVIPTGYTGLVLEKVDGPANLKVVERYGTEVDLHCGGIRKSLLAFQSDDFIRDYIQHGLARHTDSTIVDTKVLWSSIRAIRAEGVSVSYGEYIKDALGVGAPVFDANHEAIGSIGVIAPITRVTMQQVEAFKKAVMSHAAELSRLLGDKGRAGQNTPK